MPRFDKKRLRGAFVSAKKFGIPWEEAKRLDVSAIKSLVQLKPTAKPRRKERQLIEFLNDTPLLRDYYDYLYDKVEVEKRSIRGIAVDLGYKDPKAVKKHLDFFRIRPLSREEAISESLKRKGIVPPRPGSREYQVDGKVITFESAMDRVVPTPQERAKRREYVKELLKKQKKQKK